MEGVSLDMWKGAELATRNSRELFDSADILAGAKKYGVATSLMILAHEESAKALMFVGFAETGRDASDFFRQMRQHKSKHYIAGLTAFMREMMNSAFSTMEQIDKEFIPDEKKSEIFFERAMKWADAAKNDEVEELNNIIQWRDSVNSTKNLGFYVDVEGFSWSSPQDLSVEDYQKQKVLAQPLLEAAEASILIGLDELRKFHRNAGLLKA